MRTLYKEACIDDCVGWLDPANNNRGANNRYWYTSPEGSLERFRWGNNAISKLADFNASVPPFVPRLPIAVPGHSTAEAQFAGITVDQVIDQILGEVAPPTERVA